MSEEQKANLRRINLGRNSGSKNPMYGKSGMLSPVYGRPHSEIERAKISAKLKGRKLSDEHKAKMSKNCYRPTLGRKGEDSFVWKGNDAQPDAGRARALKLYNCPEGLERHHIDGNPLNNSENNVMFVTRKQHMELDGRLKSLKGRHLSETTKAKLSIANKGKHHSEETKAKIRETQRRVRGNEHTIL